MTEYFYTHLNIQSIDTTIREFVFLTAFSKLFINQGKCLIIVLAGLILFESYSKLIFKNIYK